MVGFLDTKVASVQTASWFYPTTTNYGARPASGEIDVAESYSLYPDRAIPYMHDNTASSLADPGVAGVTNWHCMLADPTVFHSYVAEWTAKGIKISFDGVTCLDHTWNPLVTLVAPKPFDKPFSIILSQVLGIGTNGFNADITPLPATSQINWVHVWS